jgi:tripeptide aminopeptidase
MGTDTLTVDLELLKEILAVESYPDEDDDMIATVLSKVDAIKGSTGSTITTSRDSYGNIYVVKGDRGHGHTYYPCAVAHLDTVHERGKNLTVMEQEGELRGVNGQTGELTGIGGDDKVGIFICLEMLRYLDAVKLVFFRNEEGIRAKGKQGRRGSQAADMKFFDDVAFVLQPDRKGNADFIDNSNNVQLFSEEFFDAVQPTLKMHGYSRTRGISTDVGQLKLNGLQVCCANVSCGYYEAHHAEEYVVVADVERCLNLFCKLLTTYADRRWEHRND